MAKILALLLLCGSLSFIRAGENPPAIPVTTTWKDLLASPAIEIGGGATVRVGIEANRCPLWSGVVVYCLAEKYKPDVTLQTWRGEYIGPLQITVETGKLKLMREAAVDARQVPFGVESEKCQLLYMSVVGVSEKSNVRIELKSRSDTVVASTELAVTDEIIHPWMPWYPDNGLKDELVPIEQKATGNKEEADTMGGPVMANASEGIALPCWDSMDPVIVSGIVEGKQITHAPEEALPKLIPVAPDERVTLSYTDGTLTIASREKFTTSLPHFHFLTRWWVNGKPFIPKQAEGLAKQDGLDGSGKKLKLRLHFTPAHIGAKSGDKIGLQLLYCPDDWKLMSPQMSHTLSSPFPAELPPTWLTNRVEFIAP